MLLKMIILITIIFSSDFEEDIKKGLIVGSFEPLCESPDDEATLLVRNYIMNERKKNDMNFEKTNYRPDIAQQFFDNEKLIETDGELSEETDFKESCLNFYDKIKVKGITNGEKNIKCSKDIFKSNNYDTKSIINEFESEFKNLSSEIGFEKFENFIFFYNALIDFLNEKILQDTKFIETDDCENLIITIERYRKYKDLLFKRFMKN